MARLPPVRCPCCRRAMRRQFQQPPQCCRPGETKYKCMKCDATFSFNNWTEYNEACAYERRKTENWHRRVFSPEKFNPSFRVKRPKK